MRTHKESKIGKNIFMFEEIRFICLKIFICFKCMASGPSGHEFHTAEMKEDAYILLRFCIIL